MILKLVLQMQAALAAFIMQRHITCKIYVDDKD